MENYDFDNYEYDEEDNPIEEMIDRLNFCRLNFYKLYKKDYKIAAVRLREDLEIIIQTAKQMKKDALKYKKVLDQRYKDAKQEALEAGCYNKKYNVG